MQSGGHNPSAYNGGRMVNPPGGGDAPRTSEAVNAHNNSFQHGSRCLSLTIIAHLFDLVLLV